jgi:hypothetical protein
MIEIPKLAFAVVLALLCVLAFIEVRRWDRSNEASFRLQDLLMSQGRASNSKTIMFATFCLTSWAFVYLVVTDHLSDFYATLYFGTWAAAKTADKALDVMAQKGKP